MSGEKTIYDEMKALEKTFGLTCCKLLEKHPLYDYRTGAADKYTLSVLLIGIGIRLEMLRDKILSNGQLLNTRLEVTILTEDPELEAARLEKQAPELHRFINIRVHIPQASGGEKIHEKTAQWDCGTLIYRAFSEEVLCQYQHCRYILISAEQTIRQSVEKAFPVSRSRIVAYVKGNHIKVCGDSGSSFAPNTDGYPEDIEEIAYLLHYAYERGNNPHITTTEIRQSFLKPYNYESNIECALHVRSKLVCAGATFSTLDSAANEFAAKLAADEASGGKILEQLSRLEHRRWCISKFVKGFTLGTPEQCYLKSGDTTHSAQGKWHIALVPYGDNDSIYRRLTDQDWVVEDPDGIEGLDELDKQTLRVHRHCRQLAQGNLAACIGHAKKLESQLPPELKPYAHRLADALNQMYQGERSAVFLFRHHLKNLNTELDKTRLRLAKETLSALNQDLGAPLEYLTRKDYKEQNFILIRQIPFALSQRKATTLVKLMADQVPDCVNAAWQLEPEKLLFLDVAESMEELMQIRSRAMQINHFLTQGCNPIQIRYHIFVPQNILLPGCGDDFLSSTNEDALTIEQPTFSEGWDYVLHRSTSMDVDAIRRHFVELMAQIESTAAIDMTGGKPALISLADGYAHNSKTGAFFVRDNRIRNFYGAESLEQHKLDKGLSVQELFAQAGARRIKQDSEKLSGIFHSQYAALWKIALDHTSHWYRFCQSFAKAYRDQPGNRKTRDPMLLDKASLEEAFEKEANLAVRGEKGSSGREQTVTQLTEVFFRITAALVKENILKLTKDGNAYTVSCDEALSALLNSGKPLEYYLYCTAQDSGLFQNVAMSWYFQHSGDPSSAANELDVICTAENTSLFISAKHVSLDTFKTGNFLNYVCYEVGWLADRFGGINPRLILAAPNVPMFDKQGRLSNLAERALSRGVHLLGTECFRDNNLLRVLKEIRDGSKNWYACLEKAVK